MFCWFHPPSDVRCFVLPRIYPALGVLCRSKHIIIVDNTNVAGCGQWTLYGHPSFDVPLKYSLLNGNIFIFNLLFERCSVFVVSRRNYIDRNYFDLKNKTIRLVIKWLRNKNEKFIITRLIRIIRIDNNNNNNNISKLTNFSFRFLSGINNICRP